MKLRAVIGYLVMAPPVIFGQALIVSACFDAVPSRSLKSTQPAKRELSITRVQDRSTALVSINPG